MEPLGEERAQGRGEHERKDQLVVARTSDLEDDQDGSQRGPTHDGEHRRHADHRKSSRGERCLAPPDGLEEPGKSGTDRSAHEQRGHERPTGCS